MSNRQSIPEEVLRDLYEEQKWSMRQVGKKLHRDPTTVRRELQRYGIRIRSRSEEGKLANRHKEKRIPKETLFHLYWVEQRSASEIAEMFGCDANTVRKEMRRQGVRIRSLSEAQQLSKGVAIPEEELRQQYESEGLSQQSIADRYGLSRRAIGNKMRKLGIKVRSHPTATTKYPKRNFDGTPIEQAYLIGFRQGDLTVRLLDEHGETLRVEGGSTQQEQLDLIQRLFQPYGHVWVSRPNKKGYRAIVCFLNLSFSFLLPKQDRICDWILSSGGCFAAYLAGYTDAEGSFSIDRKRQARFQIGSHDTQILHQLHERLVSLDIACPPPRLVLRKGHVDKRGITCRADHWTLGVYRKAALLKLIDLLGSHLRHPKRRQDMRKVKRNVEERSGGAGSDS